jgi:phosphatidylglycerophosphate synthase
VTRSPGVIINIPNLLTLLRILITPLFVIFMIKGQYRLSLLIFFLAGVSDGLDGLFARWFNQKTVLGAHLDPIADKLLLKARSSAGECYLHTVEVTGSIPVPPTNYIKGLRITP